MRRRDVHRGSFNETAAALALFAFACGKDALVGGPCRQGLTECNQRCVDVTQDTANCGVCGRACASGQTCSAGTCGSPEAAADTGEDVSDPDVGTSDGSDLDTTAGDVAVADRSGTDGTGADVSGPDGLRPDTTGSDTLDGRLDGAGADAADIDVTLADGPSGDGTTADGAVCMPPYNTPERCGDCFTRCAEPTPLCGLQGTYRCVARCDPPLVACGAVCINTASDERNCGACGTACPSGICQAGACVGQGYGHEIVIGTDYSDATLLESSAQATMLGNAVFLTVAANVRVLAYDEFADAVTVARIETWISNIAATRGKSVTITKATDWTAIPTQLTVQQYQVFFVYDQARAPANQMATAGTLWNAAMHAYAKGGGTIVALDGGSVGRMRDLLTNGGLLPVLDETDISTTQLNVDAPTDVVGQNLPNVFAAKRNTVAFTTTQMRDNYHVFVVTDMTGMLPVVVHSVPR